MFSTSILDALATFGYVAAAFGLLLCVMTYYAIPKMAKLIIENDENKKE